MAEAFLRKYAPKLDVISAGTHPKSELNTNVVKAMQEIGIDITNQKPKELTNEMISQSIAVNMGCIDRESCPALFVKDVIDWKISDPKDRELEQIREIRDQIESEVLTLIEELNEE